ncbi:hypothetical protein EGW07_07355 [Citrobacter amalonaticus]|nr:hypothetical protein EGW07_07355 [Citrobacter amalonaticus]
MSCTTAFNCILKARRISRCGKAATERIPRSRDNDVTGVSEGSQRSSSVKGVRCFLVAVETFSPSHDGLFSPSTI